MRRVTVPTAARPTRADGVDHPLEELRRGIRLDEIIEHRRHHTLDPKTVIVEFSAKGAMLKSGNDYRMDYVSVIEIAPDGIDHH